MSEPELIGSVLASVGLSPEQLEARMHGLGSSDVGSVIGENPFKSPHDVWLEKRGLVEPEPPGNPAWFGARVEAIVAERYTLETGRQLVHGPGTVAHPEHAWAMATTDRETPDAERIVECKEVGHHMERFWSLDADGAPHYVIAQAQWQMLVRRIPRCDVAVRFAGTSEFRIYEFTRDEALCASIFAVCRRFWFDNVLGGEAPRADGTEGARRMLSVLYPRNVGEMRSAPGEALPLVERYLAATATGKAAEAEAKLCGNKLREIIGDAEGLLGDGFKVTWRADKNGQRTLRVTAKGRLAA